MIKLVVMGLSLWTSGGEELKGEMNKALEGFSVIDLDSALSLGVSTSEGDRFAHVMAKGDFNQDGIEDLAIGIPFFDLFGALEDVGAVLVMMGSPNGFQLGAGADNQMLFQVSTAEQDDIEADDKFGWALTVGDYNDDGYDDLVVGTPFEDVFQAGILNAGAINVFMGGPDGLDPESQYFHQGSGNTSDSDVEPLDQFGMVLASGDLNGDDFDDLVVGVPLEDLGSVADNHGAVRIYYGGSDGLDPDQIENIHQNTFGVGGDAEEDDLFGWSLVLADFDGDGFDDLAVGVPGQEVDGAFNAGEVQVFEGSAGSLVSGIDYFRSQSGEVSGVVEAGDEFGHSLAAGDINNDGFADLVVGVWKEDVNASGIIDSGGVNIMYGALGGLLNSEGQFFGQHQSGVLGTAANTDRFGEVVWVDDLNLDGFSDVVVGTPNDRIFNGQGQVGAGGGVNVLYGTNNGVTDQGDEYLFSDELNNDMGWSVVSLSFGNQIELIVGLPGIESEDNEEDSGAIYAMGVEPHDLIFKDGFE